MLSIRLCRFTKRETTTGAHELMKTNPWSGERFPGGAEVFCLARCAAGQVRLSRAQRQRANFTAHYRELKNRARRGSSAWRDAPARFGERLDAGRVITPSVRGTCPLQRGAIMTLIGYSLLPAAGNRASSWLAVQLRVGRLMCSASTRARRRQGVEHGFHLSDVICTCSC